MTLKDKLSPGDGVFTYLAVLFFGASVGCLIRQQHVAKRVTLGLRCEKCKRALSGLAEGGTVDDDYVNETRLYERDGKEAGLTRKQGYTDPETMRGKR